MAQIDSVAYLSEQETISPKGNLTKLGNRVCLLLILASVIGNVIQFLMVLLMSVRTALQHKTLDLTQNALLQQLVMYIPTFISLVIILLISRKMLSIKILDNYHKPKKSISFVFLGCFAAVGASMTGVLFSNVITSLLSRFSIQSGMANISTPNDLTARIVNIGYLCIITPILEETFFSQRNFKKLATIWKCFCHHIFFRTFWNFSF